MKKKFLICFITILSVLTLTTVVFAGMHSSGPKWVRSTEHYQLYYRGEAYSRLGRGVAHLSYFRGGVHLGSITAVVPTWSRTTEDYKTITIRDSLNPWAPKTHYRYHF